MKYRFALLALMAVSAAPLAAQGGGGGGAAGGAMGAAGGRQGGGRGANFQTGTYDQLNEWFAFTADQKPKVEAAIKDRDAVLAPMRAYTQGLQTAQAAAGGGRATIPPDSTAKMTAATTKFQETLKSILAGPQVVKFDSIAKAAADRAARGGAGGRGGRGGGGI